ATLDGNDARNGRCARCSFLGESGRHARGGENKESAHRGERPSAAIPLQRDPRDPPNSRIHTPPALEAPGYCCDRLLSQTIRLCPDAQKNTRETTSRS